MKYNGFPLIVLCLVFIIPFSLEKDPNSSRLITKWELEFLSLNFRQLLRKFSCSVDQAVPNQFPVSVVVGYVLPNGHTGKIGMTIERPEVNCSDGSLILGNSGSSNRMTISAVNDETCLKGARLQLYINIRTKDALTPTAKFHKAIYSGKTEAAWTPTLLLDSTDTTILRLNWRMSCGELNGRSSVLTNSLRLKRQAQDEPPTENALGDLKNETKNWGFISEEQTLSPETSTTPDEGSTKSAEILTPTAEESETFSSGEPPDSFVTGISEIFGLTKNPLSPEGLKTTHPSTASKQFSTLLQTLFGATADVTSLLNRRTSISVDPSLQDNGYTVSVTSLASSSSSPEDTQNGLEPDFAKDSNNSEISAPAAGQGDSQKLDLENPRTDANPNSTVKPDVLSPENTGTVLFTQTSTPGVNDTLDNEDKWSTIIDSDKTVSVNSPDGPSSPEKGFQPSTKEVEMSSDVDKENTDTIQRTSLTPSKTKAVTIDINTEQYTTTKSIADGTSSIADISVKPKKTTATTTKTTTTFTSTTTSTTTTRIHPSTRRDVIFTKAKPKPTAPYPETSNEPFMGKTGETSSAGRVEDPSLMDGDSNDERTEATLWPIVMGLVIGIPTIIVLSIAITVVQKKHIGVPHRHLSSPGYFERRPPPVPFVIVSKHDVSSTVI